MEAQPKTPDSGFINLGRAGRIFAGLLIVIALLSAAGLATVMHEYVYGGTRGIVLFNLDEEVTVR